MKRALFAAALLPLFAVPCLAQDATAEDQTAGGATDEPATHASGAPAEPAPVITGTVPGRGGVDPWSGIVIVVTPAPDDVTTGTGDAGEALGLAEDAKSGEAHPAAADAPPPLNLLPGGETAAEETTDEMPSLWTSLDLGFGGDGGMPAPRKVPTVPTRPVKAAPAQPLPTSFDYKEGPAQLSVVTSVSTTPPTSEPLSTVAGGGSGEVKGRLGYVLDNWSVYGLGGLGAAESTGAVSVYDSLVLGGTYSVPLAPLGMGANDSLGAKLEVGGTQATTSIEMRSGQGNYQRFISVERSTTPDAAASDTVRAGMIGKF